MINNQKLLFVHIPKTAGTSIKSILNSFRFIRNPLFSGHDPYFYLQSVNDLSDVYSFAVVRNPYTRTYSFYKNFNQSLVSYGMREITFNEFLRYIRSRGTLYSPIKFNHIPQVFFDQLFYIQNDNSEIELSKVYRFEQIQELERDLNQKLYKTNSSNYTQTEYLESYTKQNMRLVCDLFYKDFCVLNYSFHFDDSFQKLGDL